MTRVPCAKSARGVRQLPAANAVMSRRSVLCLALCVLALGCSSGAKRLELKLEFAQGGDYAPECVGQAKERPPIDSCLHIELCQHQGSTCVPVAIGASAGSGQIVIGAAGEFAFEIDEPKGEYAIGVSVVDGAGQELARGRIARFSARAPVLSLRLYQSRQTSCAAPAVEPEGGAVPRAFHASHVLPNGDVLIFGGVTGESIAASGFAGGAPLQRAVEIFYPQSGRFARVAIDGSASTEGFGRVLFASVLMPSPVAGPFRVRVLGGFSAIGDAPVLRFDEGQGASPLGLPVLPAAGAVLARSSAGLPDPVDLVYEPLTRTLRIEPVTTAILPHGGFVAVSAAEMADDTTQVVTLGAIDGGQGSRPEPGFANSWYAIHAGRAPDSADALGVPRLGNSVSELSPGGPFLAWGGNVDLEDDNEVFDSAGEFLRVGEPADEGSFVPSFGVPVPVFHTASGLGSGGVIFVGGLVVGSANGAGGQGVTTALVTPTVSGIAYDSSNETFTPLGAAEAQDVPGRVFHSASELPNGQLLVVGGAGKATVASLDGLSDVWLVAREGIDLRAQALPGLLSARFGHTATLINGVGVLVVGGISSSGPAGRFATLGTAEMVPLFAPLDAPAACP